MSGDRPIRVGLVGLGNSGWFYHAKAHLAPSPHYELVAVCARDASRATAAARAFGGTPYTDWRDVVAADVELVVVALPHHLHRDVAVAAAEAGRHVHVEKPMAVTTAEADDMIDAARRAGVLLTVHQQRRFEQDFQVLRQMVADGAVGDIWHVEVARSHAGRYRTAGVDRPHVGDAVLDWPHQRAFGGGISYLVGPHPVDQLLTLLGSPVTVAGRVHREPGEDVDHYIAVDVTFASGATGRVSVFRRSGIAPPRFAVYGTRGALLATNGTEVIVQPFDGERRVRGGLTPPSVLGTEIYAGLYDAIRHGAPPPVTAEQGRMVVEVIELALRSAERGGTPLPIGRAAEVG
jgi:predicted dehydrogenase